MTVSVVQALQTSTGSASATTIALAFGSAVASGNYIYAAAFQGTAGATTMTCADSINGSYPAALDTLNLSGASVAHFAFGPSAGGTPTVTVTYSATSAFRGIFIAEITGTSGLDTGGTYHSGNAQNNPPTTTDAITSGTLTPSIANGMCISASVDGNLSAATFTSGTGFTDLVPAFMSSTFWQFTTGANHADAESKVYSSTAPFAATYTVSGTATFDGTVAVLFAQSGTPPILMGQAWL
jgi:cobalamin synthase